MADFAEDFEEAWLDGDNSPNEFIMDELLLIPKTGRPLDFAGAFGSTYRGEDMGITVDIQGHNVQCYLSEIESVKVGDIIQRLNNKYEIVDIEPDGTGWITMILRLI